VDPQLLILDLFSSTAAVLLAADLNHTLDCLCQISTRSGIYVTFVLSERQQGISDLVRSHIAEVRHRTIF